MPNTVRVDHQSFNRGVDEILTLKPVRRSIGRILHGVGAAFIHQPAGTKKSHDLAVNESGKHSDNRPK